MEIKKRFWAFFVALCVCISSLGTAGGVIVSAANTSEEKEIAAAGEDSRKTEDTENSLEESGLKFAQKNQSVSNPTGLLSRKTIRVNDTGAAQVYQADAVTLYGTGMRGAAIYNSDWDKYKNYYIYNQLTDAQKEYWDALDTVCMKYLTTTKDASLIQTVYGKYYTLDFVGSDKLSGQQMINLAWMFRYLNPQYYFINVSQFTQVTSRGIVTHIAFGIYESFADGDARAAATAKIKAQADAWESQVNACSTEEQKVKLIHDLIVNKVEYNYDIYNDSFDEEKEYSQSVYSVFCMDLTVCAGYAQTFAMMCNACGIDAISVTSSAHEWNKVRVNDSWYNVDCTWDDQNRYIDYSYFARSDRYYDSVDLQSMENHKEESLWTEYLPACTLDTEDDDGNSRTAGIFPAIKKTTAQPVMSVSSANGVVYVKFTSATSGADIYYTVDGTQPSPASTKSEYYSGAFSVKNGSQVRAVAVRDTYWDSAESGSKVQTEVKYTVTYDANGGSGYMAEQTSSKNVVTLKANAFKKKGYTFKGWNTKADGSGKSYSAKQKITNLKKNLTLYAQWSKKNYKITYQLNGGKNNSKNPSFYTYVTKTFELKNPTRKGYTFKGWYTDKDYTKKITQIKKGTTGNKTLYAKWAANKYTIVFNGNKNTSGTMSKMKACQYGKTYKLNANKFKRTGYTFVGWNTKADGSGKSYGNKEKVTKLSSKSGGTVTLYAQWKKK